MDEIFTMKSDTSINGGRKRNNAQIISTLRSETDTDNNDPALPMGKDKNWALDWQARHMQNIDWYDCSSSHSYPLNANMKAYAAWWLWARLAGWDQNTTGLKAEENNSQVVTVFPNPTNGNFTVTANNSGINAIGIFNMLGEKVYTINDLKLQTTNTINFSAFRKGAHFLKIYTKEKIYTEKIVIQ